MSISWSGLTTWTKPLDLRHIQLRDPPDLEAEALGLVPDIIPRPALPPPTPLRSRAHGLHYPLDKRIQDKTQIEKKNEEGFLWNIWKNSLGSLFENKASVDKRSGRDDSGSVSATVIDSIGKSLTRILIKYATNEMTKLITTNNVVRE